ncbi:MAG: MtrB/PioB family outer membrane beta-barrel protein, partial [Thermoanaerobaculia bacterium]
MSLHAHASRLLLPAALLLALPVSAQETASQGFSLHIDPAIVAYESVDVDTDSAKFNEYRDYQDGFLVERLGLHGATADGNHNLSFVATRAGRDDARYAMDFRAEGSYDVELEFNRIPHRFGNNAHSLFSRTAGPRWSIADSTQIYLQQRLAQQFALNPAAINFAYLDRLLQPFLANAYIFDVGLQRDRTHAEVDLAKGGKLAWGVVF